MCSRGTSEAGPWLRTPRGPCWGQCWGPYQGIMYLTIVVIPLRAGDVYGSTFEEPWRIGLLFIPFSIMAIGGAAMGGVFSDKFGRLPAMVVGWGIQPFAVTGFAWTFRHSIGLAAPLACHGLFGFAMSFARVSNDTFCIELAPHKAASVVALLRLMQMLMSAVATTGGVYMVQTLGMGSSFTILSGLFLCCMIPMVRLTIQQERLRRAAVKEAKVKKGDKEVSRESMDGIAKDLEEGDAANPLPGDSEEFFHTPRHNQNDEALRSIMLPGGVDLDLGVGNVREVEEWMEAIQESAGVKGSKESLSLDFGSSALRNTTYNSLSMTRAARARSSDIPNGWAGNPGPLTRTISTGPGVPSSSGLATHRRSAEEDM
mmetsp:Transcript_10353/g.33433  ORF Transcript_10353/g.33433 Transcript_10353/m.33433 type:complete len:372 (+) Transcript_10353:501-1616(+)